MRKGSAVRRWFAPSGWGVLALAVLAACEPSKEGGYDAVTHRVREELPAPTNPEPPPVTAAVLASVSGASQQVVAASLPAGVTQAMVDEGQQLFGGVCVACHGAAGAGSPAGPQLNDAEWLNISGEYPEIVNLITVGVAQPEQFPGAMPARGGGSFTDAQVSAIAAYVYALSHPAGT